MIRQNYSLCYFHLFQIRITNKNYQEEKKNMRWSQIVTTSENIFGEDMTQSGTIVKVGTIQQRILLIRGEKVIIDADLAEIYGVTTKALNQAVNRNVERFPPDFMFRLTDEEKKEVVKICDHLVKLKYSPVTPHAFTEHGAIMAASVLKSPCAIEVSVFVVRAFVQLRKMISGHKELARKISQLERRLAEHDDQIIALVNAIKKLMSPELPPKSRRIGFRKD
jgi:hypothetical protein